MNRTFYIPAQKLQLLKPLSCNMQLCLSYLIFYIRIIFFLSFNPIPNKPWIFHVCIITLLKTLWEKQKLLITSNFSFSPSVFYPFGELSAIFIQFEIVVCKVFQFGRVQEFSFGKGLKFLLLSLV